MNVINLNLNIIRRMVTLKVNLQMDHTLHFSMQYRSEFCQSAGRNAILHLSI